MNANSYYVIEKPDEIHAYDCYRLFKKYYQLYKNIDEESFEKLPEPSHFLLFHAVELFLKAYASSKGCARQDLEGRYGHRILCIYKEFCGDLIVGKSLFRKLVLDLNKINKNHYFRYPKSYSYPLFLRSEVVNCIDDIVKWNSNHFFLVKTRAHNAWREIESQAAGMEVKWRNEEKEDQKRQPRRSNP